jgi:hypothetical protein
VISSCKVNLKGEATLTTAKALAAKKDLRLEMLPEQGADFFISSSEHGMALTAVPCWHLKGVSSMLLKSSLQATDRKGHLSVVGVNDTVIQANEEAFIELLNLVWDEEALS